MLSSELAVGERARRFAGFAIVSSLMFVLVFAAWTWLSKEIVDLNARQPWQDDPYDVLVSLDYVVLPLLVATAVLRVGLCRRYEKLPARRMVDLLRICGVAVGACLVTQLGQWVAVCLGLHHSAWNAVTDWQLAALVLSSVASLAAGVLLHRASRAVRRVACPDAQPDWLADGIALALGAVAVLHLPGDQATNALRWIDDRAVRRVREHPVVAAAWLACLLALPYVAAKVVLEHYPPLLVLLSFALPAAALFALIVLLGRYVRIVEPRTTGTPPPVAAVIVACSVGPMVFALHDSLLPQHQTAAELNALLFGGALAGAAASVVGQRALRRFRASLSPRPRRP